MSQPLVRWPAPKPGLDLRTHLREIAENRGRTTLPQLIAAARSSVATLAQLAAAPPKDQVERRLAAMDQILHAAVTKRPLPDDFAEAHCPNDHALALLLLIFTPDEQWPRVAARYPQLVRSLKLQTPG